MAVSLNAKELILQVRQRVLDLSERTWQDPEILTDADAMLRTMFGRYRASGQLHGVDRLDITVGSFTTIATNVVEYLLPEYVGDIQYVEGIVTGSVKPVPIGQATLEEKDLPLSVWSGRAPGWIHSKGVNPGSIQVIGYLGSISAIRIWHVRSWGPLHYATVTGAGSSTTAIVVGTATGGYKNRDGLYVGMQLEITTDTNQVSNRQQIRNVTAFTSGVHTITPALPAAANGTTVYAMVIPLPAEDHEYLVQMVAMNLLRKAGRDDDLLRHREYNAKLEQDFEVSIRQRATGEPPRFTSSRGRG